MEVNKQHALHLINTKQWFYLQYLFNGLECDPETQDFIREQTREYIPQSLWGAEMKKLGIFSYSEMIDPDSPNWLHAVSFLNILKVKTPSDDPSCTYVETDFKLGSAGMPPLGLKKYKEGVYLPTNHVYSLVFPNDPNKTPYVHFNYNLREWNLNDIIQKLNRGLKENGLKFTFRISNFKEG